MPVEREARPALPFLYITVLIGEVAILATLVGMFPERPPYTYELGWIGAGSLIAMQLYSVRRRVRVLRNFGSLRAWLDAHIFLGFQGYVFVAYHSVGISLHASLAAINFALVTLVVITGVIGRYLYGWVARARRDAARSALAVAERWFARWTLLHRPVAILLFSITTLHVLAHFAYAT